MDNKRDYIREFETEEEAEMAFDAFVEIAKELVEKEEDYINIANPEKVKGVMVIYNYLKYKLKGTRAKVTYKLHEPFVSMGSVSITGKELVFTKCDWFAKVAPYANNLEIYPKTDGTVNICFTFHGLTECVKREEE